MIGHKPFKDLKHKGADSPASRERVEAYGREIDRRINSPWWRLRRALDRLRHG